MKKSGLLTGLLCVPRQIAAWYYMKLLHVWRGDELFEVNFEFKWKQPATKMSSKIFFLIIC